MKFDTNAFKAYDIRGLVPSELTVELAYAVGVALADYLPMGPVAVGRDMRMESADLAEHVRAGLVAQGREVWDLGLVTSDMSYFAVGKYQLAGAAMITASHNAAGYNGIKLYGAGVKPIGLDSGLDQIRDAIKADNHRLPEGLGQVVEKDIKEDWVDHALSFVKSKDWPAFRIAIDTGNGMAGEILPQVTDQTPLEVTPLFYDLDGSFPNHPANPAEAKNLVALINEIQAKKLDFGVAFDGDGDRSALVDDLGRPVSGSDLMSLVAHDYLQHFPGVKIVHDVRTSRSTRELIKEWGGEPVRAKAGRVSVGMKMRELDVPFGGETSGHLFFSDNYFADSGLIGALVAIQAIAASGKKLSALIDSYHRYAMAPEINLPVGDWLGLVARLKDKYQDGDQDELDGLTVNYPDWWFNLRPSNTEPVMRLNIEARDGAMLEAKKAELLKDIQG